jgi:hypothetical protein
VICYSVDAEPARAYLLRAHNDLDVFVEDATCQNMYVRLFNRMLGKTGRKITSVYPLHGRKNVIERCLADQSPRPRRRIYVIDADHDLLLNNPRLRLKHFYRLNVYCSENLLLSESAIITLGTEADFDKSWPEMALALALRPTLERSIQFLMPLFVEYAIVSKLKLPISTVQYPVVRLLRNPQDANSLSMLLIRSRIREVRRLIFAQVSLQKYRRTRQFVVRRLYRSQRNHSDFISGKTYLLPLVHLRLKQIARFQDGFDRLKVRLAEHCELSIDAGLQCAIRRSAK